MRYFINIGRAACVLPGLPFARSLLLAMVHNLFHTIFFRTGKIENRYFPLPIKAGFNGFPFARAHGQVPLVCRAVLGAA